MARFYWVFDGFVLEPEQDQDDRSPGDGLPERATRQEAHQKKQSNIGQGLTTSSKRVMHPTNHARS